MGWEDILKNKAEKKKKRQHKKKLEVKLRQIKRESKKWENKKEKLIAHAEELQKRYPNVDLENDTFYYTRDMYSEVLGHEPFLPVKDGRRLFSTLRDLKRWHNPHEKTINELEQKIKQEDSYDE
jgi:hypothetical protein